jgi:hypothetical protein
MSRTEAFNKLKTSNNVIIIPTQKSIKVGDSIACLVQWDFSDGKPTKRGILKGTVREVVKDKGVKPRQVTWDVNTSTYADIKDDGTEGAAFILGENLPNFDILNTIFDKFTTSEVLTLRENFKSKFVSRVVYTKKDDSYTPPTPEETEKTQNQAAQETQDEVFAAEKKVEENPNDEEAKEDVKAAKKLADTFSDNACTGSQMFDKEGEPAYKYKISKLLWEESGTSWVNYWRKGLFSNLKFRYIRKHPRTGCIQRGLAVEDNKVRYISDGASGQLATSQLKSFGWISGWDDAAPNLGKEKSENPVPASDTRERKKNRDTINVESGIQSLRDQLAALTERLDKSGVLHDQHQISTAPASVQIAELRKKIKRTGDMIERDVAAMRQVRV